MLINWVTKEVDDPDRPGEMLGVVLGGRPIPLREIADVLEESADSAKQHLARLKAGGYIKRAKPAAGDAYSYLVKRSKKWACQTAESCEAPQGQNATGRRRNLPGVGKKSYWGEGEIATRNKEKNKVINIPIVRADARDSQLGSALREIWDYYIQQTARNPKTCFFPPLRKCKGLARLRECMSKTGGELEKAEGLMKLAIDRLVASDFHMGRDTKTNGKRYCDWENHVFRSYEQMEGWWNR